MSRAGSGGRSRAMRIRSGDQVKVIAGKDRGKSGRVLRVEPAKRRVYVEGLNMVKRHMKPTAVRDSGRLSITLTMSPACASLFSSWACSVLELRTIFSYRR